MWNQCRNSWPMQWTPSASNLTCTCDRIPQHLLWRRKWLWIGSASVEDLSSYLDPVTGFGQCRSIGSFFFKFQAATCLHEQIWSDKLVCRHMLSNNQFGKWPSNQPVDQIINQLTNQSTSWPNNQPVDQIINQLTKISTSSPNSRKL